MGTEAPRQKTPRTIVNAGFSRLITNRRGRKEPEWKNVQGITVPLPLKSLGSSEFRDHVRKSAPEGEGWALQGYCAITKGKR